MLANHSYPIICTRKLAESVAFYEDHFDFRPCLEMDCFIALKRPESDDVALAFLDMNHPSVPAHHRKDPSGFILNMPVADVDRAHESLYMEGMTIYGDKRDEKCGRRHFMVEDPNGILLDIMQESAQAKGCSAGYGDGASGARGQAACGVL